MFLNVIVRSFPGYAVILAVVVGVSIGTVSAVHITNHFEGDVTIDAGAQSGNLILNDGNLGIGGTPGPNQLVRAEGDPNQPISFLVRSDNAEAVFNMRSFGGIPALQLTDGDSGQKYRVRIGQPSEDFEIVDTTLGQNIRLLIQPNGNVGIGVTNPQEKLDVFGNTHTSGNADIDGNLNVDGVITGSYIATLEATIADLEARLAALEASIAINVPMIVTNEATIATHDTTLASHDAMISSNQADIATNAAAIAEGGGGPNPCNPNGDSEITAQEIWDLLDSMGISQFVNTIQNRIVLAESATGSPQQNGVLDNLEEVTQFNADWFTNLSGIVCTYP